MANVCTIGSYTFPMAPERSIDISGAREIAKLDVPGGAPRYQDMGPGEKVASWSGALRGDDAYKQSNLIEAEMHKGTWLPWRYGMIATDVRIRSFNKKVIRFDYVRYSIELIVKVSSPAVSTATATKKTQEVQVLSVASEPEVKTHTVKQGDTLWGIAQKFYGNGAQWEKIASENGITNPRLLQIGQKLVIPA